MVLIGRSVDQLVAESFRSDQATAFQAVRLAGSNPAGRARLLKPRGRYSDFSSHPELDLCCRWTRSQAAHSARKQWSGLQSDQIVDPDPCSWLLCDPDCLDSLEAKPCSVPDGPVSVRRHNAVTTPEITEPRSLCGGRHELKCHASHQNHYPFHVLITFYKTTVRQHRSLP